MRRWLRPRGKRRTAGLALAAVTLGALAGGCSETGSVAPRAAPAGLPAKLIPAPPENHRFTKPPESGRR